MKGGDLEHFCLLLCNELLLECIYKSRYRDNFIVEDITSLTFFIKNIKVNNFNVYRLFRKIFAEYKDNKFNVITCKTKNLITEVIIGIKYMGSNYQLNIKVFEGTNIFPIGNLEKYKTNILEKKLLVKSLTYEERLAFYYFRTMYFSNSYLFLRKLVKVYKDEFNAVSFIKNVYNLGFIYSKIINIDSLKRKIDSINSYYWKIKWEKNKNKQKKFEDAVKILEILTNLLRKERL